MKTDVTIVIVTYNSAAHIAACLESVERERGSLRQDVVVVDNASQDGTAQLVQTRFPWVRLLLPATNKGFAAGVNLGAGKAMSEFVLLLNPDTVLLDRAVERLVSFARSHPRHGVYGGRTLKVDGTLEPSSCWGLPSLWSLAMFALGLSAMFPRHRRLDPESLGAWQRDSVREVGVVTGCFLMCPTGVWDALGGLDERYFMYGEDVDFAIRARRAGWRPVICPDAQLIHEVGQCSRTPLHKVRMLYRGKACLVRTHWSGAAQWLGLFFLVSGTGLRACGAWLKQRWRRDDHAARWQTMWRERASWVRGYTAENHGSVATD